MGLFSMSLDLAMESKRKNFAKSFKIRTITCNNQERINSCNTIKTEDNI